MLSCIVAPVKSLATRPIQWVCTHRVSLPDTDEEAVKMAFPLFKESMDKIGKTRGWQPMSREHFLNEVKNGSMYVGSPETVAQKIAKAMKAVDATRFDMVYGLVQFPQACVSAWLSYTLIKSFRGYVNY